MIVAFLLAVQAPQPQGYTPEETRALEVMMRCQKRYVDAFPRRERRRRSEALIEEASNACAAEESALRSLLRGRFNDRSTDQVMQIIRDIGREELLPYLRR